MTIQSLTPTHKAVQETYGNVARESNSCCGPAADTQKLENPLYPQELLSDLPLEVANFTAGSGDPISLAKLQPGETVLDLGSGGGLDCFLAAKQVGENGHVIGVDMTAEMLARARSSATRLKMQNVEFREGLLESLPVDDNSVDAIISNCVINLSPDKPQVLREMYRVLKPGGRVAVSDMVANHPLPDKEREDNDQWCACVSGAMAHQEYINELSKAGFVDIRIEPDIEQLVKAFGGRRLQTKRLKAQTLKDWKSPKVITVIPNNISARKPSS